MCKIRDSWLIEHGDHWTEYGHCGTRTVVQNIIKFFSFFSDTNWNRKDLGAGQWPPVTNGRPSGWFILFFGYFQIDFLPHIYIYIFIYIMRLLCDVIYEFYWPHVIPIIRFSSLAADTIHTRFNRSSIYKRIYIGI